MKPLLILPFLLAAQSAHAAETPVEATIPALIAEIYAPYAKQDMQGSPWDRPLFSRETAALIAEWKSVMPQDEPDALNDGDWLCLCQDWDEKRFNARIEKQEITNPQEARVRMRLVLAPETSRVSNLVFRREDGHWRLDNIYARSFPGGLKRALVDTIAEDRKLAER